MDGSVEGTAAVPRAARARRDAVLATTERRCRELVRLPRVEPRDRRAQPARECRSGAGARAGAPRILPRAIGVARARRPQPHLARQARGGVRRAARPARVASHRLGARRPDDPGGGGVSMYRFSRAAGRSTSRSTTASTRRGATSSPLRAASTTSRSTSWCWRTARRRAPSTSCTGRGRTTRASCGRRGRHGAARALPGRDRRVRGARRRRARADARHHCRSSRWRGVGRALNEHDIQTACASSCRASSRSTASPKARRTSRCTAPAA